MEEENAIVNGFVNGSVNEEKTVKNSLLNEENAVDNENTLTETVLDNDSSMTVEGEENATDIEEISPQLNQYFKEQMEAEETDEDEEEETEEIEADEYEEDEEGEAFDFPDEDEDILEDYVNEEEEKRTLGEVMNEAGGDSSKSSDALLDLAELVLEMLDDSKAQLCSAMSGEPAHKYGSGKKRNKALLKAFVAYMDSKEVSAPTPFGTFMLTLAIWGLPSFGAAYFHRRKNKKAKKQTTEAIEEVDQETEEQEVKGEAQSDVSDPQGPSDYTQTKEHQDGRRMFDLHATSGCYSRDVKGKFTQITLSSDKPSPEIKELIDKGYDNAKIRSIIYPK